MPIKHKAVWRMHTQLDLCPFWTRRVTGTRQLFTLESDPTCGYWQGTTRVTVVINGYPSKYPGQCPRNIVRYVWGNPGMQLRGCVPGTISRAFQAVLHEMSTELLPITRRVRRHPGTRGTRGLLHYWGLFCAHYHTNSKIQQNSRLQNFQAVLDEILMGLPQLPGESAGN